MSEDAADASTRALHGAWIAAGTLLLAVWASFGDLAFFQNTDSLIPILASVDHWTPFFWGQDRYGMLLPLLAWPFREPGANFVAQLILRAWAVLATPFLIARCLAWEKDGQGLPVGAAWAAGCLAGAIAIFFFNVGGLSYYGYNPYLQGLVAVLGGILLWEAGAASATLGKGLALRALAFLAILAGAWVTPSVLFWAAPLILLRCIFREWLLRDQPRPRLDWLRAAVRHALPSMVATLAAVGMVVGGAKSIEGVLRTPINVASIPSWPLNFARMVRAWFEAPAPLVVAATLLPPCVFLWAWRRRARTLAAAAALVMLPVAAATLEAMQLATLGWVEHSTSMTWRFASTGLFLVLTALPCGLMAWMAALGWPSAVRRRVAFACLALLVASAAWRWGWPSAARQERAMERLVPRAQLVELERLGATHVLGDYWKVYPLAWRFNMLAAEASDYPERRLMPLSARAGSAREVWQPPSWVCARVAAITDDPWRILEGDRLGVPPLERVESGRGFEIWRGAGDASRCRRPKVALQQGPPELMRDDFESGNLDAWSSSR